MLLGLSIFTYYQFQSNPKKEEKTVLLLKKDNYSEKKEESSSILFMVDIKGQIVTPGIYSFDSEARIIDVIEKAGGLTENADTSVINLSKKIWDEMVIIIYSKEEVQEFEKTKEIEKQVQNLCVQKEENVVQNDACITTSQSSTYKISLNTASLEELMSLKGIGEAKAKDIITYREENGSFKTIEEIMNVPGIGESRFAAIKEDITV